MTSTWDSVVGQPTAVNQLQKASVNPVHAYLLIGPEGCGKDEAARAFAASLLSPTQDPTDRACSLVMRGSHPDVHEIRRTGASLLAKDAEEVIRISSTTAMESNRKIIVLHEVNLMQDSGVVRLLKTVEEPAEGVFFILLADQMTPLLVTIASRCVVVNFASLDDDIIIKTLTSEGIPLGIATIATKSAHGSITRARLLASDDKIVERRECFAGIPRRINGTGSVTATIVEEILELIAAAAEPMTRQHEAEIVQYEEQMALLGMKKGGRTALEDKHKRELRRHRTDELRAGLVEVASTYRDELVDNNNVNRPTAYINAIADIHQAMERFNLNVNESLLLHNLIWSLPSLGPPSPDVVSTGND